MRGKHLVEDVQEDASRGGSIWVCEVTEASEKLTWDAFRQMLTGVRPPKLISYHCEDGMNCGGLGDRCAKSTGILREGLADPHLVAGSSE